ncbi:MAG: hypothetical protein ACR2IE_01960 [Candidatus Sumerlaeaceae bacterium]
MSDAISSRSRGTLQVWLALSIGLSSAAHAQIFPAAASSDLNTLAVPPTPPAKITVKGDQDERDIAAPGQVVEREEDESMVFRRLQHESKRRRLAADENKVSHARLRLLGIENIRSNKPVLRALPQLPSRDQSTAAPVGPPADPETPLLPAGQIFGSRWVELGPNVVYNGQPVVGSQANSFSPKCKVSGRISSAAFDPSDPTYQTLYIGGADGGVWKTTNHGATWTPLTDNQPSLATGCITVNQGAPNEIYVGTGEAVLSGDAKSGAGILVSTDSGANWVSRQSATLASSKIAQITIDRTTLTGPTRRIVAATFAGIYITSDAFQSITLAQAGRFNNVIQDLSNNQVWWATRTSSTSGSSGLYKSTNNGVTWVQQNTGIATNHRDGLADLVQAPSNPNIMYAVFNADTDFTTQTPDYDKLKIYKSTNGGAIWNQIDSSYNASSGSGQFFYNVYVAVNPVNENEIYISGSQPLYRSTNGSSNFINVASNRSLHADHQFGLFRPDGARFYDCNDGGLFYTDAPGVSDWVSLNTGLGLLQVNNYAVALHPTRFEILAGTQDNGTCRYLGSGIWSLVNAGDGGFTLWDPTDSRYVYNGYIFDTVYRSSIQGYGWSEISPNSTQFPSSSYSFPFYAKGALNSTNPNMLVLGGDSLLRNSAARTGATWADVTGKLDPGNEISAVAFAPGNGEICYLGFESGKVFRTSNMSAVLPAWTLVTTHPNGSYCSDIAVDPTNPDHFIAVFYRFTSNQVYEISNAAGSPIVTNRSAGFPAIAVNCVALDSTNPSVWYLGTEVGVYRTTTGGTSWQNYSTGLPNSAVDDLCIDNARSILLAGTHGRGVWMVGRPEIKLDSVTIDDSGIGGNGNGSIDRNERIRLTINLSNVGSEDATGVVAALASFSTEAGVIQAASVYPTLPQGGAPQGNSTAFEFTTPDSIPAGCQLNLVLTLSSNLGNFAASLPVTLRSGVPATLLDISEGFESGFGAFTQTNLNGVDSAWVADTSKPATGATCAHFEEPFPYQYQLDQLKSPVSLIPATANRIVLSFDQTNASSLYGLAGGKVFLLRDGGSQQDMASALAGVLEIKNGYTGKFDGTYTAYPNQDGYVNGGPGLPYTLTTLELDPAVWAGHTLQVVFTYNWNGFTEKRNGPTGWFIDNYSLKAEQYSIQSVAAASDWQMLK